jgi:hypothetical protein
VDDIPVPAGAAVFKVRDVHTLEQVANHQLLADLKGLGGDRTASSHCRVVEQQPW